MPLHIHEQIDATLEQTIRDFLLRHEGEVPSDMDPRWLCVLRDALKHRTFAITVQKDDGALTGYLPLALVCSRLFGRFLVSLPYLNQAGLIANNDQVRDRLIEAAVELAKKHNVQYLELRHGQPYEHEHFGQCRDDKVRMVLELPDSSEVLWKNLKAKVRNQVRKGDKADLQLQWGSLALLDDFYDVFCVNMRDLGTPVYPKKLFGSILAQFKKTAELAVVSHKGKVIAGALLVHDPFHGTGGCTQVPSASALRAFNHTNANMWMYGQLLNRAIDRKAARFDFGRSSEDSGTYRFKKQWGALPCPTVWQYHVRHGDIHAVRPDSPRYRRRIEMWQKLPVWLTRLVGPSIVRGIP